ncbi:MAG: DNA primase, partial [Gordonibacter sp.]
PRRSDQRDEEREAVADVRPMAGGGAQDARPAGPALTQGEVNRRRFEREFLSLMAQNPAVALQHADVIAQTQWHDRAHAALAQSLLSTLSDDPSASAARIVTEASRVLPAAPGILTSGSTASSAAPASLAAFLVEELAIGDAEDAVDAMRAQMADPASLDPDEFEMLFQTVSAMQKDLSRRKLDHKSLSS